jgi:hypothetical protein
VASLGLVPPYGPGWRGERIRCSHLLTRDGNSGPGTRWGRAWVLFFTHGYGTGRNFYPLLMSGRGGDVNPPMGNLMGIRKIEMYFYFQPNVHFRPSPTTGGTS